ncbi:hypothetical protein HanRHA438_Chr01g0038301 [Helianthus annuus]|nr:hypothetical protein HanRHA438_Chr01g0038301 [Helianthus annuus]
MNHPYIFEKLDIKSKILVLVLYINPTFLLCLLILYIVIFYSVFDVPYNLKENV